MALETITWYLDRDTIGKNDYQAIIKSISYGLSLWSGCGVVQFKQINDIADKSKLLHITIYMRQIEENEYPSIAITEPINDHHANIALDIHSPWNLNTQHWWNRFFGHGLDLSRTITHETGHCVGLRHTTIPSSIMVTTELALPSKPSSRDLTNFANRIAAIKP